MNTVEVLTTDDNYVVVALKDGRIMDGQVFFKDEEDEVIEACTGFEERQGYKWLDKNEWVDHSSH